MTKCNHQTCNNVECYNDTCSIELWYPRTNKPIKYIDVGLMDVRAADSIRISYDFERDGYVIEQASIFSWDINDENQDSDWQEVAFVQAWQREQQTTEPKSKGER